MLIVTRLAENLEAASQQIAATPVGCYPSARLYWQKSEAFGPDRLPTGGGDKLASTLRQQQRATGPCLVSLRRTGTGGFLIDSATTSRSFAVVGAGRLGASIALALRALGMPLAGFTAHTPQGRMRAERWLGSPASQHLRDLVARSPGIYFITVPDGALPQLAVELGGLLASRSKSRSLPDQRSRPLVAHTSGGTSVSALLPCERAGASTLVFHPLQTFSDPVSGQSRFKGAAVAVTPLSPDPEAPAALFGQTLAEALGAHPFLLADEKRGLYHAAATLACNYFVALEHHSRELFVQAGLPPDQALSLFLPLVRTTLDNMEGQGTVRALTGPLSRGDVGTISEHLSALAKDSPHLLPLYKALALAALDLVRARAEIEPSLLAELAVLLRSPGGYDGVEGPEYNAAEE